MKRAICNRVWRFFFFASLELRLRLCYTQLVLLRRSTATARVFFSTGTTTLSRLRLETALVPAVLAVTVRERWIEHALFRPIGRFPSSSWDLGRELGSSIRIFIHRSLCSSRTKAQTQIEGDEASKPHLCSIRTLGLMLGLAGRTEQDGLSIPSSSSWVLKSS